MASSYAHISNKKSYVEANQKILKLNEQLQLNDLNLSSTKDEIQIFAKEKSQQCQRLANSASNIQKAYESCCKVVHRYQLDPPLPKQHSNFIEACVNRMACQLWWKRKLLVKQRRAIESTARDLGLIHKYANSYSSPHAQSDRAHQRAKTQEFLKNTYLTNNDNQTYCLKELYDRSVSNPFIRRSELMVRVKGFEMVADQIGDVGEFYTITAPSRMHARLSKHGRENPRYDGTTPYETNQHLQTVWQRIRAKLNREGIYVYGFRVAEPNHDGTPHAHMLLFMEPSVSKYVRQIIKNYSLQEDGNEKGADKHRFKAERIDKEKGSAAGYIAKYITKNIDGECIDKDLYGNDGKSAAAAIDTWASRWGIRQFQQIGGPSVTIWRELRRLSSQENIDQASKTISQATAAASASDWAAFVMIMGGPRLRRCERPIQPYSEEPQWFDEESGEILTDGLTNYGDPRKARLKGLSCGSISIITRTKTWTLNKAPPDKGRMGGMAQPPDLAPSGALDLYQ